MELCQHSKPTEPLLYAAVTVYDLDPGPILKRVQDGNLMYNHISGLRRLKPAQIQDQTGTVDYDFSSSQIGEEFNKMD